MKNIQKNMDETGKVNTVISQRMKLMQPKEDQTHYDDLVKALGQNRRVSRDVLAVEAFQVKELAAKAACALRSAAEDGDNKLRMGMEMLDRQSCLKMLMEQITFIQKWESIRIHGELEMSDENRMQMREVLRSLDQQQTLLLSKEEIIDLSVTLAGQCAMIQLAEGFAVEDEEATPYGIADPDNTEHFELVAAITLNLKRTGKLPEKWDSLSDQQLVTMACGMDMVKGYCREAAQSRLSLGGLCRVVGKLLMGLLMLVVGTELILTTGFAFNLLGILDMFAAFYYLGDAIVDFYHQILPAGFSETKAGIAVMQAGRAMKDLAERVISYAMRYIRKAVDVIAKATATGTAAVKKTVKQAVTQTNHCLNKVMEGRMVIN